MPNIICCSDVCTECISTKGLDFVWPASNILAQATSTDDDACPLHDASELVVDVDNGAPQAVGVKLALPQHVGKNYLRFRARLLVKKCLTMPLLLDQCEVVKGRKDAHLLL